MDRLCAWCNRDLTPDNPGKLCFLCAAKLQNIVIDLPEVLDVEGVAKLLHVDVETVRRKHRRGELPDCIAGQKKLLWLKDKFIAYLNSGQWFSVDNAEEIQAIAIALKLGYPVERMTGYGHFPENLITEMKKLGHLKDRKNSSK